MRSPFFKSFLAGVACGIGMAALCLYAQKPGYFVTVLDTVAEMGRARKDRKEENKFLRKRLKAMGFSDQEIKEGLRCLP